MKRILPARQRSKGIATILEAEVGKREDALYRCALKVEADPVLNREMAVWETPIGDGIELDTW